MTISGLNVTSIVVLHVLTWIAVGVLVTRIILRRVRDQKWQASDYMCMACIPCLLVRLVLVHLIAVWGSNSVASGAREGHVFTDMEVYQMTIGSKVTLVHRTFYNTYLWLLKGVVLFLFDRMLAGLGWAPKVIKIVWIILGVSYIVAQISCFTDCRPFYLYWQVVPDPGKCSQALGQLFIVGGLNIATDLILIFLPMPTLFRIQRPLSARLRLVALFSLGFFLVATTILRFPLTLANSPSSVNRTTWASIEAVVAALTANLPTLYSLRRRSSMPTSGSRSLTGVGSHARFTEHSVSQGWKKMGIRNQVTGNPYSNSEENILAEANGKSDRIVVTQSVELSDMKSSKPHGEGSQRSWIIMGDPREGSQ